MKHLIIFLIFLPAVINAQEYSYQITSEPGDSTFQLDVITEVNATRSNVQRTKGLDTAALQVRQYTDINALYEEWARVERSIDNLRRQINVLRNSLSSVDPALEDYVGWQRERLDSAYAGIWVYIDETGSNNEVYAQLVDNGQTRLRLVSDNTLLANIAPLSRNYIRLNWNTAAGYGDGDNFTFMYSNNESFFVGQTGNGNRLVLRWIREN